MRSSLSLLLSLAARNACGRHAPVAPRRFSPPPSLPLRGSSAYSHPCHHLRTTYGSRAEPTERLGTTPPPFTLLAPGDVRGEAPLSFPTGSYLCRNASILPTSTLELGNFTPRLPQCDPTLTACLAEAKDPERLYTGAPRSWLAQCFGSGRPWAHPGSSRPSLEHTPALARAQEWNPVPGRRAQERTAPAGAAAAAAHLTTKAGPGADGLEQTRAAEGAAPAADSGKSKEAEALQGAQSSSSSGSRSPRRPKRFSRKRVLGALALLTVLTGGAVLSTSEPGHVSAISFRIADALTPLFRLLDPETAHEAAVLAVSLGLSPKEHRPDPPALACTLWGRSFPNPVGLAAGWDKDARAVEGVLNLGFGFVEIGSVTPAPQNGNPRPRVFRLPECKAVINRYGFNSDGIPPVAQRLGFFHSRRQAAELPDSGGPAKAAPGPKPGSRSVVARPEPPNFGDAGADHSATAAPTAASAAFPPGLLGVNLGKNKWTVDAASDFVQGVYTLAQYADYLVINVSSPNTPGLRKLQGRKQLFDLVKKVMVARDEMQWGEKGPPPLLVKIAPDLSQQDMLDIAAVALSIPLDGLIVGNTTVSRPDSVLGLLHCEEQGGLSGKPLRDLSTQVLHRMYALTKGRITLIGCGGISSGEDAYRKVRAGASLVQLYTGMIYEGPGIVPRVKRELAACLQRDGFSNIVEAVGADHRR